MENRNYQEELKEIAPQIARAYRGNVYTVPQGYFAGLCDLVMNKVQAPPLEAMNIKTQPYAIPNGYFEAFSLRLMEKIADSAGPAMAVYNELESIAPLLNTINKAGVYSTPRDYFTGLPATAKKEIAGEKTPVFSLGNPLTRMTRYVAAAVITVLVLASVYLFTGKDAQSPQTAVVENSKVQVNDLSEDEISSYLQNEENASSAVSGSFNENDLQSSLRNVPETEIKEFLNQVSQEEI